MKRFLSVLLFVALSTHLFAQKSYVCVSGTFTDSGYKTPSVYLSGDIPPTMQDYYKAKMGEVLNELSKNGYQVEFFTGDGTAKAICSKPSKSTTRIDKVTIDSDEEAVEVARYNLQGVPVSESERGVQIIVYSNYTTKTIIVE